MYRVLQLWFGKTCNFPIEGGQFPRDGKEKKLVKRKPMILPPLSESEKLPTKKRERIERFFATEINWKRCLRRRHLGIHYKVPFPPCGKAGWVVQNRWRIHADGSFPGNTHRTYSPKMSSGNISQKIWISPSYEMLFYTGKALLSSLLPKTEIRFSHLKKKKFCLLSPSVQNASHSLPSWKEKLDLLPLHLLNKNRLCSATRGIDKISKKNYRKKTDWIPRQIEFIESKRNKRKPEWVFGGLPPRSEFIKPRK